MGEYNTHEQRTAPCSWAVSVPRRVRPGDDAGADPSGGLVGDGAEARGGPGQGHVQVPFPTAAGLDDDEDGAEN
ncbi:hypothetical protein GCM10010521_00750 [Streptomyces rameus]|uniref:Uncharacterized protein n=1 Tax=Streptomyces rameus TaxID=68261 RepID=A0ABP6MM14_9ACTN